MRTIASALVLLLVALLTAACNGELVGGGQTPARLLVVSGDLQTATAGTELPQPLVVRVVDHNNQPVANQLVNFIVTAGGGRVFAGAALTNADGEARERWQLGAVVGDTQRVEARAVNPSTGAPIVFATFRAVATAVPSGIRRLTILGGNLQAGTTGTRLADSLAVRVLDEMDNPVPGATVSWQVQEFGGAVSAASTRTGADGTSRVAWTLGSVSGVFQVQASSPGLAPVAFGATVTSPGITITFLQPSSARQWGDSLPVRATANASTPIVRMTARVEGREANLFNGQGYLNLAGLAEGPRTLLVFAVTAAGDSAAKALHFVYNRAPQLTVVGPARESVVRTGAVRIDADCADPSGCTRVAVYAADHADDTRDRWTLVAEGTTGFHGDAPLAAFNGMRKALFVEATDGLGGRSVATLGPFFVESTPAWSEVASAGTQALDTDGTRILYVDSAGGGPVRVMVRALAGGTATELLELPAGDGNPIDGRLFPGGAIFATRDRVYERRGSATTLLATRSFSASLSLEVEGGWALWQVGDNVFRRDLASGTTILVAVSASGSDVAANGDVAYVGPNQFVYRWRDGVSTQVSGGLIGLAPRIDPTQVIFSTPEGSIYLSRGGAPVLLATLSPRRNPPEYYEVNGGWAAFVKPDAGGIGHVFSVAPDGTQRQVSSGGESLIQALDSAGEVVFVRPANRPAARRYRSLPPYTAQPLDVGGQIGEVRFEGTELYAIVGRSVFGVND